ncbi:23S rRNA pseudouridine(955/2504/2580) synthase RluC [Candidatus Albibeggiatoa sp. nov. NOAA]|uniref:23S rRNA pseudouridine(955/2504/2580) synthase RluC n=1 Tax=Candidatus Albibeggiatoa sp. nov. NOAA TaxID=3162724 RepID=UPI0032F37272|nr:23S rRNA pseudouridine(955/2504/2580) synthase RluC [Thiotrichaceae bacterium]
MATLIAQSNQVVLFTVPADYEGQRIDNFLFAQLKGVPKSYVYRILRKGEVRINKGRIKPTYRLQAGDILRLPPIRQAVRTSEKPHDKFLQSLKEAILHEDKQLLVINKPSGVAVHGGSGVSYGIIEGIRAIYPEEKQLELVHRLDRDTSGCLLIAKKRSMLHQLHDLLRETGMNKRYLALVKGNWSKRLTKVDAPLRKNVMQSGERIVRVDVSGKDALTQFQVVERFDMATLVEAHLITGRTHQIRVHCTHKDHPIAGDTKYGDEDFNKHLKTHGLHRLFLHASELDIELPDYQLHIEAPLPPQLTTVLEALRSH